MQISITLPDDLAGQLSSEWEDLPRHALEVLAADAYQRGLMTAAQVGRLLGLDSRFEVDAFLKEAGAYLRYSEQDLEKDSQLLDRLLAR